MAQTQSEPRPPDKWIPWYFVAFFITLVLVLVPMCIIAVRTNSGVVTENAYEKGLAYNKVIQASEQQNALKWHGDLTLIPDKENVEANYMLTDANNAPLNDAKVMLWLVRPTQSGMDQKIGLNPQSHGHYEAMLPLPAPGLWEVRVSATVQGQNFQTVKRITIP
jgi:nitrogen fixation protein FixH